MRPTVRGIGLILAGLALAFLATAMRSPVIATLAGLALSAPLVSMVWLIARFVRHPRTHVRRRIDPLRPSAGEQVRISLAVAAGTLDAWTHLRERVPAHLRRGHTDATGYTLRPDVRGVYLLGPATAVRTDPLILARIRSTVPGTDELVVWPEVTDLTALVRAWADHQSAHTETGQPERAPDDLTLREYQPGDDLHRVHWRASARHGELLTRQDEPAQDHSASVILDLGPDEAAHPDSTTEWLVSATASLTVAMIEVGYRLRLTLTWTLPDGYTGPSDHDRTGTVSLGEIPEALDVLARARSGSPRPEPAQRGLAVAALRAPSAQTVHTLSTWTGRRLALVVDASAEAVTELTDAGWTVQTHREDVSMEDTWSALLGGAP
ncbi:DUF58 domain-containing protein [Ruania halotolerans]|uniref:DUF58 domain-containing protein n=1 Tax=Ruania halotolerans TaxID=2897773 RepID=UPI001E5A3E39|nr:DUF58 domain-containing protein [Ruania halotolerans]UFU05132.1 DUF58 domain-containing protein [Ruania halotolerans]